MKRRLAQASDSGMVRANLGISIILREIAQTYFGELRDPRQSPAKEPLPKAVALLVDYLRKAAAAGG
jgi:hypothetical protein